MAVSLISLHHSGSMSVVTVFGSFNCVFKIEVKSDV